LAAELDILKIVSENPLISQRKISEQTGLSLGQVNFLIKKCVKKGLIKIEGQTAKSIKYNITPKGIAEKAELTAQYIKLSYAAVIKLTQAMKEIEEKYLAAGKAIYVMGEEDELMQIARLALKPESFVPKEGSNVSVLNIKDFIK
jgi:DNA-binding Lrp family transcriptional regulator